MCVPLNVERHAMVLSCVSGETDERSVNSLFIACTALHDWIYFNYLCNNVHAWAQFKYSRVLVYERKAVHVYRIY